MRNRPGLTRPSGDGNPHGFGFQEVGRVLVRSAEDTPYCFSSDRIASASIVISTILPTTIPLSGRGEFQLTPKSCRLISVVARKPARVLGPLSTALPPRRLPLTQVV